MALRSLSQKANGFLNLFGAFFALLASVLVVVLIVAIFAAQAT